MYFGIHLAFATVKETSCCPFRSRNSAAAARVRASMSFACIGKSIHPMGTEKPGVGSIDRFRRLSSVNRRGRIRS